MAKDASQDASQKPGIRPAYSSRITVILVCPSVIAVSIQRSNQRCSTQGIEIAVVVDVIFCEFVIQPIQTVKVQYLGSNNPRLHSDEVLIALAASANLDPKAARALEALAHLQGCQAHCSVILSPADEGTYRKLGIQLTCEPKYQTNKLYHR